MRAAVLLAGVVLGAAAQAQVRPQDGPVKAEQRGGTFVEPPARVDPIYVPEGPDVAAGGRAQDGDVLVLRLATDFPLRAAGRAGQGTQGSPAAPASVQAQLRWQPLEDRRWYAQIGFIRYLHTSRQRGWDPDFTYSFGFSDPRPGGWSVYYANYSGTRLRPNAAAGEHRFNFPQGEWTARYHFDLPAPLHDWLLVGDGDSALCHAEGNLEPRFSQASSAALGHGKVSLGLGCRYTRPDGWFAHASAFAWPDRNQQQPWDPDYTYGFGWSGADGWTIQYGNYSGNRWPGRDRAAGEGTLRSGSVTLSWTTAW